MITDAKRNSPKLLPLYCQSMANMIREIFEEAKEEKSPSQVELEKQQINEIIERDTPVPMYVISNKKKHFGAACIFYPNALEYLSGKFNSNLYILPSSIHEYIIVPASGEYSKDELSDMVKEINATQVPAQEILSNRVYIFDRKKQSLSL